MNSTNSCERFRQTHGGYRPITPQPGAFLAAQHVAADRIGAVMLEVEILAEADQLLPSDDG